jgi:hypothetical protein
MTDAFLQRLQTLGLGESSVLLTICLVVVAILILILHRFYWNWRLTRWAAGQNLRLLSFRGAGTWEGPSAWMRSENQSLFRVQTRDSKGRERFCWIMFGTPWGFSFGEPLNEVIWDD